MSEVLKLRRQVDKLIDDGAADGKVLTLVERILSIQPDNREALQTKIVCLIHMEKFGSALSTIEQLVKVSSSLPLTEREMLFFYKAYCYYRMQQLNEAKTVLTTMPQEQLTSHIPSRHLLAQVCFALEEYHNAATSYGTLLRDYVARHISNESKEYKDLLTNYIASLTYCNPKLALNIAKTHSALEEGNNYFMIRKSKNVNKCKEATNILYNIACAQIELHDYHDALDTLHRAEELCARQHSHSTIQNLTNVLEINGMNIKKEALSKLCMTSAAELYTNVSDHRTISQHHHTKANLSSERIFFDEVLPIWLQTSFVYYCLNEKMKALSILEVIIQAKPTSQLMLALASINWAAITGHANFYEANHKLRLAQNGKVNKQLTSRQHLAVMYNTALLLFNSNSIVNCKRVMEQIIKEYPLSELAQSLRLALAVRETKKRKVKSNTIINVKTNNSTDTNDTDGIVGDGDYTIKAATTSSSSSSTIKNNNNNTHLLSLTPEKSAIKENLEEFRQAMERIEASKRRCANNCKDESNQSNDINIDNLYIANENYMALSSLIWPGNDDVNQHDSIAKLKMQFIIAQVYLDQGDLNHTMQILLSLLLSHISVLPSVLATLIAWQLQVAGTSMIQALQPFKQTLVNNEFTDKTTKSLLVWLIQHLNMFCRNNFTEVASFIEDVRSAHPVLQNDSVISAWLTLQLTHHDTVAAKKYFAMVDNNVHKAKEHKLTSVNALDRTGPTRAQIEMLGYRRTLTEADVATDESKKGKDRSQSHTRHHHRPMRRPPKNKTEGRPDPERWLPINMRSYIKDLPDRRKKELKRLRALEQEHLRRAAHKRKAEERLESECHKELQYKKGTVKKW